MEASKEFLDSLLKKNPPTAGAQNSINEAKPDKEASIDTNNTKIEPKKEETKTEEPINQTPKKKENLDKEIDKIKNKFAKLFSGSPKSKKEEKSKENKENIQPMEKENKKESASTKKEENNNTISTTKEEEKDSDSQKEKNKEDYSFPIPNNTSKLEESKNSDSSYILYRIPQNNFSSLNLNIPENLRPKNNNFQAQNHNRQNFPNYNMSYFNPITFTCSLNTHSVRKYKMKPIEKEEEFLEKIIKIADVSNVNEFWEVFQHLKKPNQCPVGSDYHVFKKGIVPMWEDKLNKDGGKLSVLLTWKYANVIWEEVTFNFAKGLLPYYDYINGIVISVRPKFLALSFWIKCNNNTMVEKIRNALSGLLQAPSNNCFDFIPFH